jgi:hypothetical protein
MIDHLGSSVEIGPDEFGGEVRFLRPGSLKTKAGMDHLPIRPQIGFAGINHFAADTDYLVFRIDETDANVFGCNEIRGFNKQAAEAHIQRDADRFRLRFPWIFEECVGYGHVNAHAGIFSPVVGQSRAPSFIKEESPSELD